MCCRHFDPRRHTRAGYQSLSQENGLALENAENLSSSREGDDGKAGLFNGLSSSLFAVHQCQNSDDCAMCRAYGIDCLQCRATGGNDVFDYRHAIALPERAFQQLSVPWVFAVFRTVKALSG